VGPTRNRMRLQQVAIVFLITAALAGGAPWVAAQDEGDGRWAAPVNLSRSGAAADPQLVVGAEGRVHVLWLDAFDGFVTTRQAGSSWTNPTVIEPPFGTRAYFPNLREEQTPPRFTPSVVASADGRIHAFWRDNYEGGSALYTSSVPADDFADAEAWTERQLLTEGGLAVAAAAGPDGRLHVVYLQSTHSEESPAGIYTRQLARNGDTWSEPVELYESIYFRLLTPDEAHVAIAVDESGRVHVAWDDPRTGTVLYTQSLDIGRTWSQPTTLATPETAALATVGTGLAPEDARPALAGLAAGPSTVHLIWHAASEASGQLSAVCAQFLISSTNAGGAWGEPAALPGDPCSTLRGLLTAESTLVVHLGAEGGDTLVAWDGQSWSDPLPLSAEFADPETDRRVQLGRTDVAGLADGRLVVVGADMAGGGDVWFLAQSQPGDGGGLFLIPTPVPPSAWTEPADVPLDTADADVRALFPTIAADPAAAGRFHIVWSQPTDADPDGPGRALYYARWDSLDTLQLPRPVALFSSADEKADYPVLAADNAGRLHLVWSGGQTGEIMASRAGADGAYNWSNWAEPQVLSARQLTASAPAIAIGRDGVVNVVYAVPLNEGRGVYYVRSADGGESWSEATQVVDAAAAGWAMVDHTTLAVGADGTVHVAWSVLPAPGSLVPGAVFYTRSTDGGESWSARYNPAEGDVDWPQLVAVGNLEVHLAWREKDGRTQLYHRWSTDGGLNWTRATLVAEVTGLDRPVTLAVDGAARVHLAAVGVAAGLTSDSEAELPVRWPVVHRMWDGERWTEVDRGIVTVLEEVAPQFPAVAIADGDRVGLALAAGPRAPLYSGEEELGARISLLSRPLDLPEILPTPLPTLTPTPAPAPAASVEETVPPPTQTPDLSPAEPTSPQIGPISLGGTYGGIIAGAIPAGLLAIVAFVVGVRFRRRRS
jgi:hypothetical protein